LLTLSNILMASTTTTFGEGEVLIAELICINLKGKLHNLIFPSISCPMQGFPTLPLFGKSILTSQSLYKDHMIIDRMVLFRFSFPLGNSQPKDGYKNVLECVVIC
jgi:hypothetical protein